VTRKSTRTKGSSEATVVNFVVGDRTYQIDPQRQKVYRSFVEIETSKAFEIFTSWRSRQVSA